MGWGDLLFLQEILGFYFLLSSKNKENVFSGIWISLLRSTKAFCRILEQTKVHTPS